MVSALRVEGNSGRTFYRYVNEDGVQVINHQIPPEYAQKGYEVVSATGNVIKVVEPAPSEEEAEEFQKHRELQESLRRWDEELLRRYSTVRDIEATKKRKLAQVQTSIDILKSNISSIKSQIVAQQAKAANVERLGREVPTQILATLTHLEDELQVTEEQLLERRAQYDEVDRKFEDDKERFRMIRPENQ